MCIAQVVVVCCVFLEAFEQFTFKLDSNVQDLDGFLSLIYSQTLGSTVTVVNCVSYSVF